MDKYILDQLGEFLKQVIIENIEDDLPEFADAWDIGQEDYEYIINHVIPNIKVVCEND